MSLNKEDLLQFLSQNDSSIDDLSNLLKEISKESASETRSGLSDNLKANSSQDLSTEELLSKCYPEIMNSLLNNSNELIYVKDQNLNYLRASKSLVDFFGVDDESALVGKKRSDMFTDLTLSDEEDDLKILSGELKELLNKVTKTVDSSGNERWISCSKWPYLNEKGEIVGVIGVSQEVTNELSLKQEMQRYLDLFNLSKDGYLLFERNNLKIVEINESFKKIFSVNNIDEFLVKLLQKYPNFDLNTLKDLQLSHYNFINEAGQEVILEIDSGDLVDNLMYVRFHDLKNREKAFKIRDFISEVSEATILSDNLNEFFRLIHKSLEKLFNVENFYVALYDEANKQIDFSYFVDSIDQEIPDKMNIGKGMTSYVIRTRSSHIIDKKGFKELEAKGEVELIGEPAESWMGTPLIIDNKVKGVIVAQSYDESIKYHEEDKDIMNFISKEIAKKLVLVQLKEQSKNDLDLLRESEGRLVKLNQDLKIKEIELREKFEELEVSQSKLEAKNEELYKFFGIIAHDLRSPLSTINNAAVINYDFLIDNKAELESLANLPEDFRPESDLGIFHFAESLKNSTALTLEKVLNLLEWATLKIKGIDEKSVTIDLQKLFNQLVHKMEGSTTNKQVKIINRLESTDLLCQKQSILNIVFDNLLSNAIKFSRKNGIIIIDKKSEDDNSITIKISDNGVGMTQEQIKDLFIFGKNTTTDGTMGEKGTGLGLPLCKEYIDNIGGDISVSSVSDQGTTFYVKIPNTLESK